MKNKIQIHAIKNRLKTILLLKKWWGCSLAGAQSRLDNLIYIEQHSLRPFFYLPNAYDYIDFNTLNTQVFLQLLQGQEDILTYHIEVLKSPEELEKEAADLEREAANKEAHLWYDALSERDRKKVDLLIAERWRK